jgi:glutathione S-transferase
MLTLVVGSKNYSSWSLRPWLALRAAGIPFEDIVVPLDRPETKAEIARHSPSGRVPVLRDGELVVWDSLAIIEYAAERFPEAHLWPADRAARAVARSVSAEMHAGFQALRAHLPMNLKRTPAPRDLPAEAEADIARVEEIWRACRARGAGPFLFGAFSGADAMYAPVVTRFETYRVPVDPEIRAYMDAILGLPAYREWRDAALAEPWASAKWDAV